MQCLLQKNLMVSLVRCVTPCYVCTAVCRVQVSHARPSPGQHPGCRHHRLAWRDGATSGSITSHHLLLLLRLLQPRTVTLTNSTVFKPPLNNIVVAGVCAGAAVRLPGQVQQPGGPPRHLRPSPLLAGGRQQGKQVSTVNIFGLT